ncbi:MAG: hypothetical protein K2N72_12320 [Oscillospiraceae bacterium]|nr:hypothetical protein [Oscillospiraceae bacterium]
MFFFDGLLENKHGFVNARFYENNTVYSIHYLGTNDYNCLTLEWTEFDIPDTYPDETGGNGQLSELSAILP